MSRSRIHLLTVAAARLAESRGEKNTVTALREAAKELAAARARGEGWTPEEDKRVSRQRNAFSSVLNGPAKDALKQAMLQRAYDLLWDGDCMGCDALIEFLPSRDVDEMFRAWDNDQSDRGSKSKFFHGI